MFPPAHRRFYNQINRKYLPLKPSKDGGLLPYTTRLAGWKDKELPTRSCPPSNGSVMGLACGASCGGSVLESCRSYWLVRRHNRFQLCGRMSSCIRGTWRSLFFSEDGSRLLFVDSRQPLNSFTPPRPQPLLTPMPVHYRDFIHPEDDAARQQLEAIPGFQTVVKYILSLGVEKYFHNLYMAQHIRLSNKQLHHIYTLLPPICRKFGIDEPELYLEMNPFPNAYTLGDKQTFVVITSGLLDHLKNDEELKAVIAHECGHILCRHVFYRTMASMIVQLADSLGFLGNLVMPVQIALNYWSRRSELSADRAELVYLGNSMPVVGALVRLSGGPASITESICIAEYAAQAQSYLDLQQNKWDKVLQTASVVNMSHPFSAIRIHEILKWEQSDQYQRLHKAMFDPNEVSCAHCGNVITEKTHKFCRRCGKVL
ncbi:MAG: M48 family metallopeptidase [Thermoguttaceae bacterium]